MSMQIELETLMKAILADPDAALEAGWTPRHWESVGFATLARRRIQEVGDLRVVLASLGATELIKSLRDYDNNEHVELIESPFVSY
jgi:hypothetical protein